jgi:hypothetical protein
MSWRNGSAVLIYSHPLNATGAAPAKSERYVVEAKIVTTSTDALRLAIKLAVDAGEYERADALLAVLRRTPVPATVTPIERARRGPLPATCTRYRRGREIRGNASSRSG